MPRGPWWWACDGPAAPQRTHFFARTNARYFLDRAGFAGFGTARVAPGSNGLEGGSRSDARFIGGSAGRAGEGSDGASVGSLASLVTPFGQVTFFAATTRTRASSAKRTRTVEPKSDRTSALRTPANV